MDNAGVRIELRGRLLGSFRRELESRKAHPLGSLIFFAGWTAFGTFNLLTKSLSGWWIAMALLTAMSLLGAAASVAWLIDERRAPRRSTSTR